MGWIPRAPLLEIAALDPEQGMIFYGLSRQLGAPTLRRSGDDRSTRYRRLSPEDRRAIVGILGDTKRDLPAFFTRATHDVLN